MNERLNIRRMDVPEHREREPLLFDAEKEVKTQEWNRITAEMLDKRIAKKWKEFAHLARASRILKPDIGLNLEQDEEKELKQFLMSDDNHDLRQDWNQLIPLNERVGDNNISDGPSLEELMGEIEDSRNLHAWRDFAMHAAYIRLTIPGERYRPTPDEWQEMHKELAFERQMMMSGSGDRTAAFAYLASSMKILAAYHVEVTDNGLEQLMEKPKDEEAIAPIPDALQL